MKIYYQARNLLWYHMGYRLFNTTKRGGKGRIITVQKVAGQMQWSNPWRTSPYSLDDPAWKRCVDYPELFL